MPPLSTSIFAVVAGPWNVPREFSVLEILMMRSGRLVDKKQLSRQIYAWDEEVGHNAIEVYVDRLRKKLAPARIAIRTIRGLGYLLEPEQTL